MHGLINKAIESFLGDTFGQSAWHEVLRRADLWDLIGSDGFDSLQLYPDTLTDRLLTSAVACLGRPRDSLLEDLGTYLASHDRTAPLRRLLRFGGSCYTDFLHSLDDLPGRARLAMPDLDLPRLTLDEIGPGRFRLTCHACPPGYSMVMLGILRTMGDDYGALVVLDPAEPGETVAPALPMTGAVAQPRVIDEQLNIALHDPSFHEGRRFVLATQDLA